MKRIQNRLVRYLVTSFGALVLLALLVLGTTQVTSKPKFCSTCHYMKPYVVAWEVSNHKEVTCTDCHFPPGFKHKMKGKFTALSMLVNYFTGVYKKSKPWAEISDESCLRSGCHVERLLDNDVIFKEGILFNHQPHLTELRREKKLRCTSCHSQIVQGEHITVTESTCFLCHFKNQPMEAPIDDCNWCHEAPVKDGNMEVSYDHTFVIEKEMNCEKCHGGMQIGDGIVPMERCSSCHAEIGHLEKYSDAAFIHKNHVTDHKVECQNCHLVIQHKSMSNLTAGIQDCNSCHENTHNTQRLLFSGTGGLEVPPHPNPMFKTGLNCQGCHLFHNVEQGYESLGQSSIANAESCEICHGAGYSRILSQWELVMNEKVDQIEESLAVVTNAVKVNDIPETVKEQISELMVSSEYNFSLVKTGNFIHNVAYSDELLKVVYTNLQTVNGLLQTQLQLPELTVSSQLVPSECKNCHYGQETINVNVFGIDFHHNIHLEKNQMLCSDCHSNLNRHGETTIRRSQCLDCHHSQEEKACAFCHETQAAVYSGSSEYTDIHIGDFMYEVGIECVECHKIDDYIEKPDETICSICHDEEYEFIMVDLQKKTQENIQTIEDMLEDLKKKELIDKDKESVMLIENGLNQIKKDNSRGVHNFEWVSNVLHNFKQELRTINRLN